MDRIHVLIIDNSLHYTGAFKSIYCVTQHIKDIQVSYALPAKSALISRLKEENQNVIGVHYLEISRSLNVLFYFPVLLWNSIRIIKFIKKEKIQIVHVNDLYNMCGVVAKILLPRIKVIHHVRLMPDSYLKKIYPSLCKIVARFSTKIITVSLAVQKGLHRLGVDSLVIYDAIPPLEQYPEKVVNLEVKETSLLYLSNFILGKGHNHAIEAFRIAKQSVPDIQLIFAGGYLNLERNLMYKKSLIDKVKNLKLDGVIFLDFENDVERLIKSADIFLNFSESESFSLTCLEALTYGVPLIASNSGGPAELFEHEQSGLLVPNCDIQKMANAIIRLTKDKTLQVKYAAAGKAYVQSKFNLSQTSQSIRNLYITLNQ
jgi:L-malate glycosyltransferase